MTGQLSHQDLGIIASLREAEVLQNVEANRLDQTNGVILVACPDGDRFPDMFEHQALMQRGHRSVLRIHPLNMHGGALACAPCSPVNTHRRADEIFLGQITDARALKKIDVVALYTHAPCGAAGLHGVRLSTVLAHHMRAKRKIKARNEGIQVACFFHVDYGRDSLGKVKQRTYFFSREHWEVWAGRNAVAALA
jgi:hypothetical protein